MIVDVYKGRIEASKSFFDYGLFISLFPHLIAGPIQRPGHLLPQVHRERTFDSDRFFRWSDVDFLRPHPEMRGRRIIGRPGKRWSFGGQFGPSISGGAAGTYDVLPGRFTVNFSG